MNDYREHVASLPLMQALWWFIENVTDDLPYRSEIFFALRERVRIHGDNRCLIIVDEENVDYFVDDVDVYMFFFHDFIRNPEGRELIPSRFKGMLGEDDHLLYPGVFGDD